MNSTWVKFFVTGFEGGKESGQPLRAGKAMGGSCPRASTRNTDPQWISNPQNCKMQQQQSCYGPMKPKMLSGHLQKVCQQLLMLWFFSPKFQGDKLLCPIFSKEQPQSPWGRQKLRMITMATFSQSYSWFYSYRWSRLIFIPGLSKIVGRRQHPLFFTDPEIRLMSLSEPTTNGCGN